MSSFSRKTRVLAEKPVLQRRKRERKKKMATKSLIRNGVLLMNRVFANQFLNSNPIINNRVVNQGLQITPQLFPSLSKTKPSLHLTQNDADSLSQVSSMGFLYPTGLPSLRFLLPDDTLSNYAFDCFEMKWENLCISYYCSGDSSSEPMLCFPKRTYQPSTIWRKRNHGFFARKATKGGRRLITRRIAKDRCMPTIRLSFRCTNTCKFLHQQVFYWGKLSRWLTTSNAVRPIASDGTTCNGVKIMSCRSCQRT
ncbi:uncharacterized protein LOC120117935 [Hibiscus syriacus]|uniref:uncharacterized protein LOC120117935 n=1 Tax=Hibiscus syriacus TaxID=106335 RepID=UPI0019240E50|nr:uncharacterized protein LOC120117935 [Hibiscus syriacus]